MTTATHEPLERRDLPAPLPAGTPDADITTPVDLSLLPETYVGMSEAAVTEEQAAILNRELTNDDLDIRPDGLVYMSHAKLRKRLNEAFRPGGWCIRRVSSINVAVATEAQQDRKAEFVMSAEFALYAGGKFLAMARGEQKYMDNGEMTYGDAAEGMKSNALSRCCKDLGIALDLWDRAFADAWRNANCVKVWGEDYNGRRWSKPRWRPVTSLHLYGETGPTQDSPNQDRYVYQNGQQPAPPPREPEARPQPQARPAPPPQRQREPGDDDEPGELSDRDAAQEARRQQPAPPPQTPRGNGSNGGRTISEGQQKRLYAIAMNEGRMDRDGYRDWLARHGFDSDREVTVRVYDDLIAEARRGGR